MYYLFRNKKFVMAVNKDYITKENEVIIKGSRKDYEKMKFSYIDYNNNVIFDEDTFHKYNKEVLYASLAKRYEKISQIIPKLIDPDIFEGLEEVYKTKYNLALEAKKNNDYSIFNNEAKIYGVPPEYIATKIIQIGKAYNEAYNKKTMELEAARVYIKKLIENKCYDEALIGLRFLKNLTPASTMDELMNLCTNGLTVIEYCKNKL